MNGETIYPDDTYPDDWDEAKEFSDAKKIYTEKFQTKLDGVDSDTRLTPEGLVRTDELRAEKKQHLSELLDMVKNSTTYKEVVKPIELYEIRWGLKEEVEEDN